MFNVESLNLKILGVPRTDHLLVLPLVSASTRTVIDMEENREKPEKGVVLAVGPGGVAVQTGREIPMISKVGDLAVYGRYSGMKWEIEGPQGPVEVYIMSDAQVLLSRSAETLEMVVHDDDPRKIHEAGLICEYCPTVDSEEKLERLRAIARGERPGDESDVESAIAAERARPSDGAVSLV